MPAEIVNSHGSFAWGKNTNEAVHLIMILYANNKQQFENLLAINL
jgi:ribulose-5-phosphate 4-epimerase/fuculose-1-phosphate aldolase